MELIGKLSGMPLFELELGKYIAVDVDDRKAFPMWSWYANLGRWYDTFEKCSYCEEENECLEIISENKEEIVSSLNEMADEIETEDGKQYLEEQEDFYNWLESNRVYDWNYGYEDEEDKEDEK